MASKRSMDLTTGSVFKKLIAFTIPILLTNFMQQLYHTADVFVVGNFSGTEAECKTALAAVGATGAITNLLVNFFVGISAGASVIFAQARGAKDKERENHILSTSLLFGFGAGVFLAIIGFFLTPFLVDLVGVPSDIKGKAIQYMSIIFLGQPASLLFNFCAGIFRAGGNTKRPMRILLATGVVNVILNLVFVICFDMDSAGVALATVIASYLSAAAALVVFFYPHGEFRMTLRRLRFYKDEFSGILKIGLPTGLNAVLFSFSNTIVSSAANKISTTVVASVSASNSITNVVHTFGTAFGVASVSFAGQNFGAGKLGRVDELLKKGVILVQSMFFVLNLIITLNSGFFLGLFAKSEDVIAVGTSKLYLSLWGYHFYSLAEMVNACNRGFGKSIRPTIINIGAICVLRILWVWTVFPFVPATFSDAQKALCLYACIPISWFFSAVGQVINFTFVRRKVWENMEREGKLCPEDAENYHKKRNLAEMRRKAKSKA